MKQSEFMQAVNNEFTRCAKYEPNVNISIEDCAEISQYFTSLIWDFAAKQNSKVSEPIYIASTIYSATENCRSIDCDIYFDIGLEKGYVLECWYEDDVEYVFGIKEF